MKTRLTTSFRRGGFRRHGQAGCHLRHAGEVRPGCHQNRHLEDITPEEWIQKQTLAMLSELAELIQEVNFKWWKTRSPSSPTMSGRSSWTYCISLSGCATVRVWTARSFSGVTSRKTRKISSVSTAVLQSRATRFSTKTGLKSRHSARRGEGFNPLRFKLRERAHA